MRKLFLYPMVLAAAILSSCGSNQKSEAEMQAETDSLKAVAAAAQLEQQEVNKMIEIVNSVSSVMDSIQIQEKMILSMQEGTPKDQVVTKLKAFQDLLHRKQEEINRLKADNKSDKTAMANLQKMIDFLNNEIDIKNQQIADLEELVEKKDISISSLRYRLNEATERSDALSEEAYQKDMQLNSVYYVIGTKSELKEMGLLKGGFLSKKKADYANLDKNKFKKRDMRGLEKLTIESKSPKLITEKPESSYRLTKNDNGTTTLEITDAKAFWSASPFLIIQK